MNSSTALLDAGYFHIQSHRTSPEDGRYRLERKPDTAYLITVEDDMAAQRFTAHLTPDAVLADGRIPVFQDRDHPGHIHLLYRPAHNGAPIALPSEKEISAVTELSFAPKPTEALTLEYGLKRFGKQIGQLAIMVNDLGLPSGLSDHLSLLLPEAYQTQLAEHSFPQPLMISERRARNLASERVERKLAKYARSQNPDDDFTIIDVKGGQGDGGACSIGPSADSKHLASNAITKCAMGRNGCGQPVSSVPLTRTMPRDGGHTTEVPSCGVIIAGQLKQIMDSGYQDIISVHHRKDDPLLLPKIFDGMAIGSWLFPKNDLLHKFVIVISKPEQERVLRTEHIQSFAELRGAHDERVYGRF